MTKPVASGPTISLKVRRLEPRDVADYRELRLESLKSGYRVFAAAKRTRVRRWRHGWRR